MVKLTSVFIVTLAAYCGAAANEDWWKTATFYQIYPRSFMDSDGDGIGDLQGIISKLDYLKQLGITAAWLSPIFKSPQKDMGYDISDYRNIHEEYGTMDDFKKLLEEAKKREIKIILDFVPNHTSDENDWFKASVNGTAGYEDFYIWKDGTGDDKKTAPNNWLSLFEGSAWSYNDERKMMYLHQFSSYQPDLNYRNPNVQKAMMDILTFWLDLGVDGFRVDAVPYLVEDSQFLDEPKLSENGTYTSLNHTYTKNQVGTYETIYTWRKNIDEYSKSKGGDARILMTEGYTTFENTLLFYGSADGSVLGAHFAFNFDFITSIFNTSTASDIKEVIDNWRTNLHNSYTFNWVLGNHDNHRVATRFGTEHIDALNMLVAMLPGIQVTYNGEEFGMEDGEVNCEDSHDPGADCSNWEISRDFERTPMQWNNSKNAGFSTNDSTWLPVSEKYIDTNVATELSDTRSYLKTYLSLPGLRAKLPVDGSTDVSVLNTTILVVSRYSTDTCNAYHYLYNRNGADISVSFPNKNKSYSYTVAASSLQSSRTTGSTLKAAEKIKLSENEALIVKENCDKAPSSSISIWNLSSVMFWSVLAIIIKIA